MKRALLLLAALACVAARAATPSEITVTLKLDHDVFVEGERIRGVVDVANASADVIDCSTNTSPDRLIVELYRANDRYQYEKGGKISFTAGFKLLSVVHAGTRYESRLCTFDLVPGMKCGNALQMFTERDDLKRVFELVHWHRDRMEHLFLKARDEGSSNREWATTDLGPFLRVTAPKLSVLPTGEVVVLHRMTQDAFVRSEFWSLPDVFEFHTHEKMLDPDVAGAARVRELYKDAGGVEPVKKAWWKFW